MREESEGPPGVGPVAPGRRLGNLLVEKEIGRGGYSSVFLARDVLIGRPVALKVLRPPPGQRAEDAAAKFLDEARILGGLRSPRIVTLHQVHEAPGGGWMLEMEYLDGGTLHDRVRAAGRLPPGEVKVFLRAVLEGLSVAHEAGVLHRDLKPGNVLLGRDGAVKLADFGLARFFEGAAIRSDSTGRVEGTPWYMAPEVLMREPATVASDLWSAGVMIHEMLTGRVPFDQEELPGLFVAVQNARPRPLPTSVPRVLALVASRCLEKRAADRASSARELLDIIEHASGGIPDAVMERATYAAGVARLAGRGRETARLDSLLEAARGGKSATLLVTGEAGVGKSALLREARYLAELRGFLCVEARVTAMEGPLLPLLVAARAAARGPATPAPPEPDRPEPGDRGQAAADLERTLASLSEGRPLCVLVDDVHLAREEDAALLLEIRRRLSGAPFLLVLAGRSGAGGELPSGATGDRGATALAEAADLERLHLGPLEPETLYQVLEARSRASVPSEVAARIAERSGGNPRLALDLLRHLVEAGALVPGERALRAAPGWDAIPLPQRFHEVVEARLAGLEEEDRSILEAAAVDGMDFDGRAVAAATGIPLIDALRRLQRLVRRGGIVRPREDGYRFAHASVRDVLYESLAPELRREVHRSLAEHLDSRGGPVDPARLAAHWEGAGDAGRAAPLFLEAAFASGRRQELRRTAEGWDRAKGFVDGLTPEALASRGRDLLVISLCLQSVGRTEESNRLLDRLVEAAWGAGDREVESRARVWRTALNFRRRGLAPGEEEELRHAALADGPPERSRGHAALVLGMLAKRGGDMEGARGWFLRAQADFQALPSEAEEARVIEELGSVSLRRGEKEEAERLYAEAARMYRRLGRRSSAAVAEVNRARAARMRGVLEGVDTILESAVRTLSLEGNHHQAAHAQVLLAEAYASLGRIPEGLETIDSSVATLRGLAYLPGLAGALVTKTFLFAEAGRTGEALASAAEAGSAVEEHGDISLRANLAAAKSIALVLAGRRPDAEAAAASAVEFQRGTSEPPTETVALLAEAVAFGLHPSCLAAADPLLPADFEKQEPVVAALRRGVLALVDPAGTPADLDRAAGVLAADFVSERRASLRILGKFLGSESRRRRGDGKVAAGQAIAAVEEARALGLGGLEAALRRRLGGAPGGEAPRTARS